MTMKKLLFFFLLIPILIGCEDLYLPTYSEPSEVHLTGGVWTFVDYQVVVTRSISNVTVIKDDVVCINAFGEQSYVLGGILMEQNYDLTMDDRKFIKGVTTWEFDFSSYRLIINGNKEKMYNVTYPSYMRYEHTQMCVTNPYYGAVTNYTFITDAIGGNYPLKLTLTSPSIVSDLLLSNGMRDKAVTVQVILTFTRN